MLQQPLDEYTGVKHFVAIKRTGATVTGYGRLKSEKQTKATGTTKRKEGRQPEETRGVVIQTTRQKEIAASSLFPAQGERQSRCDNF